MIIFYSTIITVSIFVIVAAITQTAIDKWKEYDGNKKKTKRYYSR